PARFVALALAQQMINIFMNTPFEGGRHANRVGKIACN
ncbi:MAG: RpiB/LacA/LacB family sugar-phosphate isomerase, partial [Sediminibacterium sp.]